MPKPTPGLRWCVYLLRCRDGSLYTGATNDLARRVARHLAGKGAAYTRSRLPVKLVFEEEAAGRSEALRREHALKQLTRAQKLALVGAGVKRPRKKKARAKPSTAAGSRRPAPARPSGPRPSSSRR